jgi:activator of 2-hydroxyglutaryl-CoA dehydratase
VAVDAGARLLAWRIEPASPRVEEQAERLVSDLRAEVGPVAAVGATGYGRKRIRAALALTEITCHARGAFSRTARPGVLVDVGGQDTKVIRVGAGGEPLEGIVKGLHQALASRVAALARSSAAGAEVFMSGGVALNAAMVEALRLALGRPVSVVPEPQLVGALGAALSVAGARG